MYLIVVLVVVVLWALPIILCVKVWRMCNDVNRILNLLEDRFDDRLNP